MSKQAKDVIINELKPFIEELKFKPEDDAFLNEKKAFKIEYQENRKQFILSIADVIGDTPGEYTEKSSWLYDESHSEKDAKSIANDFQEVLRENLGMKTSFKRQGEVALPGKSAPGTTPGIEAFTQRFLTLFPQFKEDYKNNVADYGEFLYDHFYTKNAVPLLKDMLKKNSKKQINKMFDMLEEYYNEGDRVVGSTIVYTIMGGTFRKNPDLWDTALKYMDETPVLKQNSQAMKHYLDNHEKRERFLFWQKRNNLEH